eukprot:6288508-Pyramimonas_sp.AAC.1
MAIDCSVVGTLNLVITDANKPTGYECRIDNVDIKCSVVIMGPQYRDPPAPTDLASAGSDPPHLPEELAKEERGAKD